MTALLRNAGSKETEVVAPAAPAEIEEALRAARVFRAAVADATHAAVSSMLPRIAHDVLARELQLAPCDIGVILKRALERYFASTPVRVRAHPDETALLDCGLPVVADVRLERGDVCVDLRDGCIDATLRTRLQTVVQATFG